MAELISAAGDFATEGEKSCRMKRMACDSYSPLRTMQKRLYKFDTFVLHTFSLQ